MIRVFTAKSGAPTLSVGGVAVHSAYDPVREAERFVRESMSGEHPATVVVLGEGLGHVANAVRALFPSARVIPVMYSAQIAAAASRDDPSWHPGSGTSLAAHLRARLDDLDVDGLRVIEWPPSSRLFPDISRAANQEVRQVVQELNGSVVTTVAVGRLWVRNTLANLVALDTPLTGRPCGEHRAVVIAASGPSLEQATVALRASRGLYDLWALPSSCSLLEDAGLLPDLVVMTDPGFYSLHHVSFTRLRCPLAMPLSAARGSWALHRETAVGPYILSQPSFYEAAALESLRIAVPRVAPHGTVAATAVDLALSATTGPVILAGLDLCGRDILSHGRPNAFDTLLHLQASRIEPHTSLLYRRAALLRMEPLPGAAGHRSSPSLRVYAGWLDEASRAHAGRLFRLLPTPVSLAGMQSIDERSLPAVLSSAVLSPAGTRLQPAPGFPSATSRRTIALALLRTWARAVKEAEFPLTEQVKTSETAATSLAICATLAPRLLLDARHKARQGDTKGSEAAREAMVASAAGFLDRLGDRIRGAG